MCRSIRGFLFFQAEDGIRDIGVTGVQTCALPILCPPLAAAEAMARYAGWRPGTDPEPARLQASKESFRRARAAGVRIVNGSDMGVFADRKRVGEGKSVDLGGRRCIKKKTYLCVVH